MENVRGNVSATPPPALPVLVPVATDPLSDALPSDDRGLLRHGFGIPALLLLLAVGLAVLLVVAANAIRSSPCDNSRLGLVLLCCNPFGGERAKLPGFGDGSGLPPGPSLLLGASSLLIFNKSRSAILPRRDSTVSEAHFNLSALLDALVVFIDVILEVLN